MARHQRTSPQHAGRSSRWEACSRSATSRTPWTVRYLQGHIDAPFVSLTPGTRTGLIRDAAYAALAQGLEPLERHLIELIEEQRRTDERIERIN